MKNKGFITELAFDLHAHSCLAAAPDAQSGRLRSASLSCCTSSYAAPVAACCCACTRLTLSCGHHTLAMRHVNRCAGGFTHRWEAHLDSVQRRLEAVDRRLGRSAGRGAEGCQLRRHTLLRSLARRLRNMRCPSAISRAALPSRRGVAQRTDRRSRTVGLKPAMAAGPLGSTLPGGCGCCPCTGCPSDI